jgi:hypothetical protein
MCAEIGLSEAWEIFLVGDEFAPALDIRIDDKIQRESSPPRSHAPGTFG